MSGAAARAARPLALVVGPRARRFGDRLTSSLRSPEVSASKGATRIRLALATVFAAYGLFLSCAAIADGGIPAWPHAVMVMMSAALFTGRGGTFVRDWVPVILGFLAYTQAAVLAERLHFSVHYLPQVDADRILGFGILPTQWLQERLYGGETGVLEVAALAAYASHYFVPLALAFYIWWSRGRHTFNTLIFGLLAVSVLGEITFVLAPTAPPWLAAQDGYIPHVHEILKQALADVGLNAAAALKGDPNAYNVVAAVPSLHVAWPVVGLLAIRTYGLPRWAFAIQAAQLAAVVFTIVYTGEHYLVDAFAGALYAVVAWWLVQRALGGAGDEQREKSASSLRTAEGVELRESADGAPRVPGGIRASRTLRNLAAEDGQALFEYAAIVSIVSIVAFGVLKVIGGIVNDDLSSIAGAL
jgi:Flp pilus assembly pilin Flp